MIPLNQNGDTTKGQQMQQSGGRNGPPGSSAMNPVKPGESRPGWDDSTSSALVVHSETDGFVHGR